MTANSRRPLTQDRRSAVVRYVEAVHALTQYCEEHYGEDSDHHNPVMIGLVDEIHVTFVAASAEDRGAAEGPG